MLDLDTQRGSRSAGAARLQMRGVNRLGAVIAANTFSFADCGDEAGLARLTAKL